MARISEKVQRGIGIKESCCTREMNYTESITNSPREPPVMIGLSGLETESYIA